MFTLIDALERKPKGKPDMSPHAVNTFVSDLVQMAQAMERLPQIELRVSELESENDAWMHKYESLQNDIAQAKAYASTLEQRLHDAEVAKDVAETMFLEADDRTSRALDFIKATFGNAGTLIQALEPPRPQPEPVVEPKPEPDHVAVHSWTDQPEPIVSEVKPIAVDPTTEAHTATVDDGSMNAINASSKGQSEPDPIPTASQAQPEPVADTISAELSATSSSPGPYAGKHYFDIPQIIPYSDWTAGGGTEDDYYWRPNYDTQF